MIDKRGLSRHFRVYFALSFFSSVQSWRCRMAGLSPMNIFEASLSPFSCQSSQARATMANSPP
ncbi:MAG: hypothetical protein J6Y33_04930 [Prevotella sp.]|nr:hypothetical protein [Prevotella sp.]